MKKLLTVSTIALFAFNASAQVYNNGVQAMATMGRTVGNGNIVYNVSPLPPIQQGNRIVYPSGSALVANGGGAAACNSPLTIDNSTGTTNITCHNPVAANNNNDAANLANLAPAAGGPHTLSDRNLSSDTKLGLRNDREIIGQEILR